MCRSSIFSCNTAMISYSCVFLCVWFTTNMAFSSLFEMFFIFFRHFQCLFKSLLIVLLHSYSLFTIYNFFEYLFHKFINSIFSSVHLHRFAKFIIIKINSFITKSIICVFLTEVISGGLIWIKKLSWLWKALKCVSQ